MIDADMEDIALSKVAEREQGDVANTWAQIKDDLRKTGPIAKILLSFRASAIDAMADLVSVDPKDADKVTRLQGEVLRFLNTMTMIHAYREKAEAVDANSEADISDDEQTFLNQIEDYDQ